jgi:lipopolysaccharide transport system permease protein
MDIKIYSSANEYNLFKVFKEGIKGYKEGFYLSRLFVLRGFKAKYKTSYVGYIWEVVPSITTAIVWIFLRGSGAIVTPDAAIPFPAFVLIGTIMWSVITDSISKPMGSFSEYSSIISKINIPKESLLLIGFFNILINHAIKLILVVFLLIFYGLTPSITLLYFIPILLLTIVFFMSLGVWLLPLEYMLSDIARIKNYGLMALMYLTPVVYANPGKGIISTIMNLNPLTYIIDALRNSLTGLPVENLPFFLGMSIVTALMAIGATIIYRITTPIIIQRIGS